MSLRKGRRVKVLDLTVCRQVITKGRRRFNTNLRLFQVREVQTSVQGIATRERRNYWSLKRNIYLQSLKI